MAMRMKPICGVSGVTSDRGDNDSARITYDVWDPILANRKLATYFADCLAHVRTNAPMWIDNTQPGDLFPQTLYRGPMTWREDEDTGHILVDVEYKMREISDSTYRWTFDTQGGTVKIFTSRNTTRYGSGAPDHQGSIDVNDQNEPQGVDIVLPALKFSIAKRWAKNSSLYGPTSYITYMKALAGYTGMVCSTAWQTFPAGELLFLGASGQYVPYKDNEIEYHFAHSPNMASYNIGPITGVAKEGHDYVWIKFEHALSGTTRIRRPKWAYVERVYDRFAPTLLGI